MPTVTIADSVKQEYLDKQKIRDQMAQYYVDQTTKNGLHSLERTKAYIPEEYQFLQMKRNIVFSHLDLEPIIELIARKQEFTVVSGLNPSSPLHLGHKGLFDVLLALQKLGARIFIPITNDETYVDGKAESLAKSRKTAYEEIIPSIIAFGFDPEKTHIYVDSDYPEIYNFAMSLSQHVSVKKIDSVFGDASIENPGQVFYRGVVQMAMILQPQLPEFGGIKPVLIPVGIDQHPYLLMARDVAKKLKMIPPSELVMKFQQSLRDPVAKMSGSKPDTAIFLSDTPDQIKSKINKAYTGAVSSLEGHQQLGGVPEICSVFSLLHAQHPDDKFVENIKQRYLKGQITMGELKKITSDFIVDLVREHQEKRQKITAQEIKNFILTRKLVSLLE